MTDKTDKKEPQPADSDSARPGRRRRGRGAASVPEVVWPSAPRSDSEAEARARFEALHRAFHRGDFAAVRAGTPQLVAECEDEEVRLRAQALRARLSPDPLAIVVAAFAILLWIFTFISAVD